MSKTSSFFVNNADVTSIGNVSVGSNTMTTTVNGVLKVEDGKFDEPVYNLISLFLQGKDPKKNKELYLKEISNLHWVKNCNLKTIDVYGRIEKMFEFLDSKPEKKRRVLK